MSKVQWVSEPGVYNLMVTSSNGCFAMAMAIVTENTFEPDVIAEGGVLDCDVTSIQLEGSSTALGAVYSWTGPNGFESSDEDPIVTAAGIYILTVKGLNGCEASAEAVVVAGNPEDCCPGVSTIGDRVWDDVNRNGLQDEGENGMPDVWVNLHYCDSTIVDSTLTDSLGVFSFEAVKDTSYFLTFELPSGYTFTLANNPFRW